MVIPVEFGVEWMVRKCKWIKVEFGARLKGRTDCEIDWEFNVCDDWWWYRMVIPNRVQFVLQPWLVSFPLQPTCLQSPKSPRISLSISGMEILIAVFPSFGSTPLTPWFSPQIPLYSPSLC